MNFSCVVLLVTICPNQTQANNLRLRYKTSYFITCRLGFFRVSTTAISASSFYILCACFPLRSRTRRTKVIFMKRNSATMNITFTLHIPLDNGCYSKAWSKSMNFDDEHHFCQPRHTGHHARVQDVRYKYKCSISAPSSLLKAHHRPYINSSISLICVTGVPRIPLTHLPLTLPF